MADILQNGSVIGTLDPSQFLYKQFDEGGINYETQYEELYKYIKITWKNKNIESAEWTTCYIMPDINSTTKIWNHNLAYYISINIGKEINEINIDNNKSALMFDPVAGYNSKNAKLLKNIKQDPYSLINDYNFYNGRNYESDSGGSVINYSIPAFKFNNKYLKYRSEPSSDIPVGVGENLYDPNQGVYKFNTENDFGKSIKQQGLKNWGIVDSNLHKAVVVYNGFNSTEFSDVKVIFNNTSKILSVIHNWDTDDEWESEYFVGSEAKIYFIHRFPSADGTQPSLNIGGYYYVPTNGITDRPSIEASSDMYVQSSDQFPNRYGPIFRASAGVSAFLGRAKYNPDNRKQLNPYGSDAISCTIENKQSLKVFEKATIDNFEYILQANNIPYSGAGFYDMTSSSVPQSVYDKFSYKTFIKKLYCGQSNKYGVDHTGSTGSNYQQSWLNVGFDATTISESGWYGYDATNKITLNLTLKYYTLNSDIDAPISSYVSQFKAQNKKVDNNTVYKYVCFNNELNIPLGVWRGNCNWCEVTNSSYSANQTGTIVFDGANYPFFAASSSSYAKIYAGHSNNTAGYGLAIIIGYPTSNSGFEIIEPGIIQEDIRS